MTDQLPNTVAGLAEAVRSIEDGCGPVGGSSESTGPGTPLVPTGWAPVDAEIGGGLPAGAVHEWFANEEEIRPLGVLGHLAAQAVGDEEGEEADRWAIWIGRACWPHPLTVSVGLRRRSLFVAPPDREKRLWAAELAARSPAVGVAVVEGEGLRMAATRRLQLAARARGALVLLTRPPAERGELSAAATRWRVCPAPSPDGRPRWRLELVRRKGMRRRESGTEATDLCWELEWSRGRVRVAAPAGLVDPTGPPRRSSPNFEKNLPQPLELRLRRSIIAALGIC